MSLVNKIPGDNRTFGDIAESIFLIAIKSGNASSRKYIVFDVYKDISIKTTELEGRWVARYNGDEDCWEVQQVKLPPSNFFAKLEEMIHTQRSLAANFSSLDVGNRVSKSLKMALRSLINLLPPRKKLTHARCFIPNMLPVTIHLRLLWQKTQMCLSFAFQYFIRYVTYVYPMWNKNRLWHIDISKVG